VPFWFYVASNLSMRLHGVHAFDAFPMVVRCGGMFQAFGPRAGRKVVHPETGDTTILCEGFNRKNQYDRESPCDPDFLRKMAKDTDAQALMRWFGGDGLRIFRRRRALDREGVFIGDASYLFVPDNPRYEGSAKLLFDEHDHPISQEQYRKMTDDQKIRCQWRRCYKMVTLLHTNSALDFFLFVAVRVVPGNDHECPVLYALVEEFVHAVGKGVMKRLILDRGFLDGKAISQCKEQYGIDILIPIRRNMDLYADGHQEIWFLIDTREVKEPERTQQEYHLRVSTEERYRQLKCFSDLTHFTSRAFSMVVNQVVFIMLAYNLLQIYLLHRGRKELNQKTLPRIRQQLLPSDNPIIVYYQNYYGLFAPFELIGFVVTLREQARQKIAAKCRRIGRELNGAMQNPRPP